MELRLDKDEYLSIAVAAAREHFRSVPAWIRVQAMAAAEKVNDEYDRAHRR
jgi:hypothetical protein